MLFANGRGDVPSAQELEQKLQIKPGQSVAVVNVPPESRLRLLRTAGSNPDQADVVIGFAVRPADLAWLRSVYAAARAGRLVWVIYPSPGQPGTDLRRDWLIRALRQYGVEAVQDVSINRTWSALQLRPVTDNHQPDSSTAKQGQQVSHKNNDQTPDEGTGDTTPRFRADFLGELQYHLERGDFSRWLEGTIADKDLAAQVAVWEDELLAHRAPHLERIRHQLVRAVEQRYPQ